MQGGLTHGLKKLGAVYLIGVAIAVAVFFVVNSFLVDSIEVMDVWYGLDVLMFVGLVIALPHNYARKLRECSGDPGGAVTRRYLDVNAAHYLTVGVTILFLHNWLSLLAGGPESLDNNDPAWVIWAVVDTLLPIVFAVTGRSLWKESA